MSKYDTVVFDFDGAVADTAPDIIQSVSHIIDLVGSTPRSNDFIAHAIGGGAKKILIRCLDEEFHPRVDGDILTLFKDHYDENCDIYTSLYPMVNDTLAKIKDMGIKTGLATMKVRKATLKICKTLDVEKFFDVIVTPEDVEKPKPDPESVMKILDAVGSTPAKSLMVGDTKTDILTAQNAGMDVAVVPYGYGDFEGMKKCNPTYIIDTFDQLLPIIAGK